MIIIYLVGVILTAIGLAIWQYIEISQNPQLYNLLEGDSITILDLMCVNRDYGKGDTDAFLGFLGNMVFWILCSFMWPLFICGGLVLGIVLLIGYLLSKIKLGKIKSD